MFYCTNFGINCELSKSKPWVLVASKKRAQQIIFILANKSADYNIKYVTNFTA